MIKSWFNNDERIAALESSAQGWVGTPFVANSRCKGERGGVSCQMLAEQVYIDAGLDLPFRVPNGSMRWSDISKSSLIEDFLTAQTDVFELIDRATSADVIAGDLIGFKLGGCVHHLGVALTGGRFIHVMRGITADIFMMNDATYMRRIEKIWRPKP